MEDGNITYIILDCSYYQGNRVVEGARCGNCGHTVYVEDEFCSECGFQIDWDDEVESGHGDFMSFYN